MADSDGFGFGLQDQPASSRLDFFACSQSRYFTVYSGQINSIVSLTTSSDVSTDITDQTAVFYNSITGAAETDLQYGLSLSSYESWMTDTFSFNITLVSLSITNITVRFEVLNNTFFTKAKSQYIVVWRNDTASKNLAFSTSTPSLPPTIYNNI